MAAPPPGAEICGAASSSARGRSAPRVRSVSRRSKAVWSDAKGRGPAPASARSRWNVPRSRADPDNLACSPASSVPNGARPRRRAERVSTSRPVSVPPPPAGRISHAPRPGRRASRSARHRLRRASATTQPQRRAPIRRATPRMDACSPIKSARCSARCEPLHRNVPASSAGGHARSRRHAPPANHVRSFRVESDSACPIRRESAGACRPRRRRLARRSRHGLRNVTLPRAVGRASLEFRSHVPTGKSVRVPILRCKGSARSPPTAVATVCRSARRQRELRPRNAAVTSAADHA